MDTCDLLPGQTSPVLVLKNGFVPFNGLKRNRQTLTYFRKDTAVFTLPINILFAEQIDSMKSDLAKYLPHIKSSHRVEALARALGFKTYASLRARDLFLSPIETEVNWSAFHDYLKGKGFQVTAKPLYLAAGRASVRLILEMPALEPNLTREGNGINTDHHKGETAQEYAKRFHQERLDMLLDSSIVEFLRSYCLVSRIPHTRTVTTKRGAYALKHIAENVSFTYPDGEISPASYVCTGSLICAALHAGFYYKPIAGSQSVHFNMLQKGIDDLDCEIRPDGAMAQARASQQARKKGIIY